MRQGRELGSVGGCNFKYGGQERPPRGDVGGGEAMTYTSGERPLGAEGRPSLISLSRCTWGAAGKPCDWSGERGGEGERRQKGDQIT